MHVWIAELVLCVQHAVDVLLVLNAVVVGIQTQIELANNYVENDDRSNRYPFHLSSHLYRIHRYSNGSVDTAWEYVETLFTILYTLEVRTWSKI